VNGYLKPVGDRQHHAERALKLAALDCAAVASIDTCACRKASWLYPRSICTAWTAAPRAVFSAEFFLAMANTDRLGRKRRAHCPHEALQAMNQPGCVETGEAVGDVAADLALDPLLRLGAPYPDRTGGVYM
jgi:hypothetical protein